MDQIPEEQFFHTDSVFIRDWAFATSPYPGFVTRLSPDQKRRLQEHVKEKNLAEEIEKKKQPGDFPVLFHFRDESYLVDDQWNRFHGLAVGNPLSENVTFRGRLHNRVTIVTGAARGFGAGIAEQILGQGGIVLAADIDEKTGKAQIAEWNEQFDEPRAFFIPLDVRKLESFHNLANIAVTKFGGIDLFISNAGVLKAGEVGNLSVDDFRFVTDVNYTGYFLGVKAISQVMKLQNRHSNRLSDIIQINSKSGLQGSAKNSAYAGGKFGGIGLTQSFALELVEHGIKVNSICPGNFFDGPLWSNPENGLFVQYLRTGKVPGAKTIEDVKKFYENKVPMGRGCTIQDVTKAILYIVEQEYETGQAIPVTGGQVMLS